MHSGALASDSNRSLATGLDHAGANAQALGAELRIAHAVTVPVDVVEALAGFLVGVGMKGERGEDVVDFAIVEFIAALLGSLFR